MKIKVAPKKGPSGRTFSQEITRRKNELSRPMAVTLAGNEHELDWVIFQEFGTATRRQADEERGIPGPTGAPYRIPSITNLTAKPLIFPDPEDKYILLEHLENGYVITDVVHHPGVAPKFFIRSKLDQIREDTKELIVQAIINPKIPYSFKYIKNILFNPVVRNIIDRISDSMSESLRQTREDGRLTGEYPEVVFREKVIVIDSSNQTDASTD